MNELTSNKNIFFRISSTSTNIPLPISKEYLYLRGLIISWNLKAEVVFKGLDPTNMAFLGPNNILVAREKFKKFCT